jgi:prepilin-type N-terminal cleavage/methylation domain-containing protein
MQSRNRASAKPGFTLPEVLVTIALIAALAAVVVPTIAGQLSKGEPNRVGSDYSAIRGAAEQFLSDVRKYPRTLAQLTNAIQPGAGVTDSKVAATGAVYTTADTVRWRGPYLSKDSTGAKQTGFGYVVSIDTGSITSSVSAVAGGANWSCPIAAGSTCAGALKYLLLRVAPATGAVDSLDWLNLDKALDDGVSLTGSIRYSSATTNSGAPAGAIRMLLLPIQP